MVKSQKDAQYKITKLGFDKLPIWSDLTKTFIESYWITSRAILRNKENIDSEEYLLKSISYFGKRYYKQGIIEHIGAISRFSYKNAMSLFMGMVLKGRQNSSENEDYNFKKLSDISKNLYEFIQQVR